MKPIVSYEKALAEVDTIADGLGHPVDENIKHLVAALRMFGVRTTGSCEGHSDWGHPYPWVELEPEDMLAACALEASQNRPKRDDGTDNTNIWVVLPGGPRLVPWDIKRPLDELHHAAKDFAERLRFIATLK